MQRLLKELEPGARWLRREADQETAAALWTGIDESLLGNNSPAASAPGRSLTLAPVPPRVVLAGYLEFLLLQDGDGT
jgi:hypothetical protein